MLTTSRLILKPLTHHQLEKYAKNDGSLEKELGLNESSKIISKELKEALEQTIIPNVADGAKDFIYNTLWTIILQPENKIVGDICIIGEPTPNGEIEIGYGVYEEFRGRGIMTEAVACLIAWAKKQPRIKFIVASTEKTNKASYKVLESNGFEKAGEIDEMVSWSLSIL